ncbi:MAG: DivIVA domain-containing protein [Oscillibacter sp.]
MLTPQEVSTHAFAKAMMGGYNMAMVDEFLDELTDDYTALYKENAGLKAKMKVLVEKVEDYRSTEDSMRATLLTAQKMADSIIHEAEVKRDQVLAQAETEARTRIGQLQQELSDAETRLRQGQLEMARFIAAGRDLCAREVKFLEQLPQLELEAPVPDVAAEETAAVEEIGERVLATFDEEEAPEEPEEAPPAEGYPDGDPFTEDETATIRLNDLRFGRNYSADE